MSSAYEQARLKNIQRNNIELKRLGLDAIRLPKPTSQQAEHKRLKRKKIIKSATVPRMSTRKSLRNTKKPAVDYTGTTIIGAHDDSDYDDLDDLDDVSDSDDDSDYETLEPPSKKFKNEQEKATKTTKNKSLLTVENAKTGRSSCRLCRETISKDTPRVGMMSWIVGRNAITWQHPKCFLSQLSVSCVTSNSKTKCKATLRPFEKGQVKIGCTSHTTTSWVSLDALPALLAPVLNVLDVGDDEAGKKKSEESMKETMEGIMKGMKGTEVLNQVQQHALDTAMEQTKTLYTREYVDTKVNSSPTVKKTTVTTTKKKKKKKKKSGIDNPISTQPKIGMKSNAKGHVSWKFGAYLCHGKLIPSKETLTHCYARTHKGNIKTLKKGGTYWYIDALTK